MTQETTNNKQFNELYSFLFLVVIGMSVIFGMMWDSHEKDISNKIKEDQGQLIKKWYAQGNAIKMLPELKITEQQEGLNSSLIYSGKDAQGILLNNADTYREFNHYQQTILVRSALGSYYTVILNVSDIKDNDTMEKCSKDPYSCAYFSSPKQVSLNEAKARVFHSELFTPESYYKFFGEEPPADTKTI